MHAEKREKKILCFGATKRQYVGSRRRHEEREGECANKLVCENESIEVKERKMCVLTIATLVPASQIGQFLRKA